MVPEVSHVCSITNNKAELLHRNFEGKTLEILDNHRVVLKTHPARCKVLRLKEVRFRRSAIPSTLSSLRSRHRRPLDSGNFYLHQVFRQILEFPELYPWPKFEILSGSPVHAVKLPGFR